MGNGKFIDLTESEALEANLAALGVVGFKPDTRGQREIVFDTAVALVKETGAPVGAKAISLRSGVPHRQTCDCLRELYEAGRAFRVGGPRNILYVPRVV